MVEHRLAQVVLDALAQHAGQVDEAEDRDGLEQDDGAVDRCQTQQRLAVAEVDALVDELLVQVREVGIRRGGQRDGDHEAQRPFPVGPDQVQDATQDGSCQLRGVFFLFQFDKLLFGHCSISRTWRWGGAPVRHGKVQVAEPKASSSSSSMRVWISEIRR